MQDSHTDRPSHTSAPCVFVLGCDRSGTTLLQNLLNAHPDLFISYETNIVRLHTLTFMKTGVPGVLKHRNIQRMLEGGLEPPPPRDTPYPRLIEAIYQECCKRQEKRIWGDKTPAYSRQVAQLADWYPDACFIHIVRDPRAVALSWSRTRWGPMTAHAAARRWVARVSEAATQLERHTNRSVTICFEDLVHQPETTLGRVCAAIGVAFDARMLDIDIRSRSKLRPGVAHLHPQHDKPLNRQTTEHWKNTSRLVLSHVESVAHQEMARWGYQPVTRYPRRVSHVWIIVYRLVGRARQFWRRRVRRPAKSSSGTHRA